MILIPLFEADIVIGPNSIGISDTLESEFENIISTNKLSILQGVKGGKINYKKGINGDSSKKDWDKFISIINEKGLPYYIWHGDSWKTKAQIKANI